jgi:hypothetical protein
VNPSDFLLALLVGFRVSFIASFLGGS